MKHWPGSPICLPNFASWRIGFDRLDKISLIAIIALVCWIGLLIALQPPTPPAKKAEIQEEQLTIALNPEARSQAEAARKLLAADNLKAAEKFIDTLIEKHPVYSEGFMLRGDLYLRKNDAIKSMQAYRQAISLNSDYLDKKTSVYQGKKIKNMVTEAQEKIKTALAANPDDSEMKKARKDVYYMLRRLAGSCGS